MQEGRFCISTSKRMRLIHIGIAGRGQEKKHLCWLMKKHYPLLIVTTSERLRYERDTKHEQFPNFFCLHLKSASSTARTHPWYHWNALSVEICFCYVEGNARIQIDGWLHHNKHPATLLGQGIEVIDNDGRGAIASIVWLTCIRVVGSKYGGSLHQV